MASDQLLKKDVGEEFTCIGEWWIPQGPNPINSEPKCFGTLTFSRGEGIKLDIMGWLENKLPDNVVGDRVGMIWGTSIEGEVITLTECQRAGMTMGKVWTESYTVREVFASKNVWFAPDEDITFTSLQLQYTHLAEWVGISGFQPSGEEELNAYIRDKKARIEYKRPNKRGPILLKDYEISIEFGNNWPGIVPTQQEATVKQYTWLTIEPANSKDIPLHDVRVLANVIRNFLSLMMYDNPILPVTIEGTVNIGGATEEESNANIRVLYVPIEAKSPNEKVTRHDVIFPYEDVTDIWERALNKLAFIEDGKLKSAFNEFFAEYFTPPKFTEDKFMATLRALEILHLQMKEKDCYISKEEYNKKLLKKLSEQIDKARLKGDISQEFQESLKKRLSYSYRYSLSTRLDDLLTEYGEEFLTLFVGKNKNDFIQDIVATYRWLTHSDKECKGEAFDTGSELAILNLRLQLFAVVLLLHYIGIPGEKIDNIFKRYEFSYLKIQGASANHDS
ncbi:MAG: ApeA N-terminal domain 1-containing protein [Halobacteriota archaeon]